MPSPWTESFHSTPPYRSFSLFVLSSLLIVYDGRFCWEMYTDSSGLPSLSLLLADPFPRRGAPVHTGPLSAPGTNLPDATEQVSPPLVAVPRT